MKRIVLALCALAAFGCESPKAKRLELDQTAVQARLQRYSELMLGMNTRGLSQMFAPDGVLANPKRPPVRGPETIRKFLDEYKDYKVLSNVITAATTVVDGDTAEQTGTYSQKVRTPDGQVFEAKGRIEVDWIRSGSGQWLITELETFPGG
jgi:ketosteroid isomerase-like protein